jgi:HTH-type transcriptional regulator/antitoxin HigA
MKTARPTHRTFADLPEDYAGLCREFLPRPIRTKADYAPVAEMADVMAVHQPEFTRDQEDYFDMLCRLLEVWDREHVTWPDLTPLDLLRHLLEQHVLTGADLSRLLGVSPKLGPMILRGERAITADHARALGAHFGLPAGVFIE